MYSFSQPSPAEVEAYVRRARALRSRAVCGFFRRLIAAFGRRPAHSVAPVEAARTAG